MSDFISIPKLAARWRCSPEEAQSRVAAGRIPTFPFGGFVIELVQLADVEAFETAATCPPPTVSALASMEQGGAA